MTHYIEGLDEEVTTFIFSNLDKLKLNEYRGIDIDTVYDPEEYDTPEIFIIELLQNNTISKVIDDLDIYFISEIAGRKISWSCRTNIYMNDHTSIFDDDNILSTVKFVIEEPISSWDKYFNDLAYFTSTRSKDPTTKHGAVIVDEYHRVLSMGYNGAIQGIRDKLLDLSRPNKYRVMLHAEQNALAFLKERNNDVLSRSSIYITGRPCSTCFNMIVQHKIKNIYYSDVNSNMITYEDILYQEDVCKQLNINMIHIPKS